MAAAGGALHEELLGDVQLDGQRLCVGTRTLNVEEVIGVRAVGSEIEVATCVKTTKGGCMGGSGARVLRKERMPGDAAAVNAALREASPDTPSRVMVIVNPTSGTGRAARVWKSARAVLEAAGIDMEVLVTSRKGEAREVCRRIAEFDGVVVVGGDGTMSEVVRGLFEADVSLPVCQVPAGSGNAFACSIAGDDAVSAVDAAYYVVKGRTHQLDLIRCETGDQIVPSFLSIEWAFLADVDLGSESLRCLGDLRFHLAAVYRICCLRRYEGRLSYLPPGEDWVVVDAENFHVAIALNLSHIDASTPLAPDARPNDGLVHLVFTCGSTSCGTRLDLLDGMLKVETGEHVDKELIHIVPCRAFRFEPSQNAPYRAAIDGEEIPNRTIEGTIVPGALRFYR